MLDPALLQTFLVIAEGNSFSEASRKLGLSQPTVSDHVRKLEAAVGHRLFVRDTHSVALTIEGEAMVEFARNILETNERARRHFAGTRLRGRLRFGASEDLVSSWLPEVLRGFVREHPLVDLEFTIALSNSLIAKFDAGELDIALCKRWPGEERGELIWRDSLVWAGATKDPIFSGGQISADPLSAAEHLALHGAGGAGAGRNSVADRLHERQPQRTGRGRAGRPRDHGPFEQAHAKRLDRMSAGPALAEARRERIRSAARAPKSVGADRRTQRGDHRQGGTIRFREPVGRGSYGTLFSWAACGLSNSSDPHEHVSGGGRAQAPRREKRLKMKFYMTPGSCSTGIHIILEELDKAFEAYIVNLPAGDHFKPDYVAINPKSTIPTLVRDDGTSLTEVQAIAYWLGRAHPRAKLLPEDIESATRIVETLAFVVGTVHGQGFARIFATPTFTRNEADHEAVRAFGRELVEKCFGILNDQLGAKDYVAGQFSIADPILFYVEFWADKTKIPLPANLQAHYKRMLARPAVQRVLREEGYNLASLGGAA